MRVAILGYGVVGKGVEELLLDKVEIVKILKRKMIDHQLVTTDFNEVLKADPEVIVECMGGLEPAHTYCIESLKRGIPFISANKKMLATYYDEIMELSNKTKTPVLFEAAVAGGIPWIHNLKMANKTDSIQSFMGIMNGTTNYILSAMSSNNADFEEVLKQAQSLGYAEADPSDDIDGYDALYKCVLSCNVAFNTSVDINSIVFSGIRYIKKEDIEYAKSINKTIKLVASATLTSDGIEASVLPVFIDNKHLLASINDNLNCCILHNSSLNDLVFVGQGAGRYPTANAVVSDVLDITYETVSVEPKRIVDKPAKYYLSGEGINSYLDTVISSASGISKELTKEDINELKKKNVFIAKT